MVVRHSLTPLLEPASVAVIGASVRERSVGARVLHNLRAGGFAGPIHAINPRYRRIDGQPCHARIGDVGQTIDLALVTVPAAHVDEVIDDCARAGVRGVIVLSAGYAETGREGLERQHRLVARVRDGGMRMLGPNCFGVMRPAWSLDATFGVSRAAPGNLALISQSGGVAAALVDWAAGERVGLSAMVSLGAAADLDFGELIDFFVCDPATRAIVLYVEGIRDGRAFLSAVRAALQIKPVVVLKAGRHAEGRRAVSSHTGALLGDDAVFDAALARGGAVRVHTVSQLFAAAGALATARRPVGDRLAIVSNGGGPGVLAADHARGCGLRLAALDPRTEAALRSTLPPAAGLGNPIDVLGDADPARYATALRSVHDDAGVDGIVALFVPQGLGDADEIAAAVVDVAGASNKPVIAAWMGGVSVAAAHERFEAARVPHCHSPESAVSAFDTLARTELQRRVLLRAPAAMPAPHRVDASMLRGLREEAIRAGREWLDPEAALRLLAAFGLPTVPTEVAGDDEQAVAAAERLGWPVALKLVSPDVLHKSDVGGVALGVADAAMLLEACRRMLAAAAALTPAARVTGFVVQPMRRPAHTRELLLGLATDPVFGRVVCFGAGGTSVEVVHDVAFALPPLDREQAAELVARTRVAALLAAYRDVPAIDRQALLDLLCRLGELACLLPWVVELDANPLLAHPGGALILDARVRIDPHAAEFSPRYEHVAIHPYPALLEQRITLPRGESFRVRPIRPDDAALERAFIEGLSPETRRRRFHDQLRSPSPELVARFTQIDYDRELALVALPADTDDAFAAVARYARWVDPDECEFAITVGDAYQGRGLGFALMRLLIDAARRRGYRRMHGMVLACNDTMLALARDLGFTREREFGGGSEVEVVLDLRRGAD